MLNAKKNSTIPLGDRTPNDFLVIAFEAATSLGWEVAEVRADGFTAFTGMSMSSWGEQVRLRLEGGMAELTSSTKQSQLTDWGRNKRNLQALELRIAELSQQLEGAALEEKRTIFNGLTSASAERASLSLPEEGTGDFFDTFFKPREGYWVSPILIMLNVVVYLLMVFKGVNFLVPEVEQLIDWGGNLKVLTAGGEPWRLFTSLFLHGGILHLLLNMYALLFIGITLEPLIGSLRFLGAYFIAGIAASVTSMWWNDATVSVGASGAIFGLYGVFLALLTTRLLDKAVRTAMLSSILVFVAYNILNGMRSNSMIDNAAHLGGLISGLLIGYAYVPSLKWYGNLTFQYLSIAGLSFLLLIGTVTALHTQHTDVQAYENDMQKWTVYENMALDALSPAPYMSRSEYLNDLKNRGVYYWRECLALLDRVEHMKLPTHIVKHNMLMREYCQLRIKSYDLIYKAVDEETDAYDSEIESTLKQVEDILNRINSENSKE